jgi:hypothetical protein
VNKYLRVLFLVSFVASLAHAATEKVEFKYAPHHELCDYSSGNGAWCSINLDEYTLAALEVDNSLEFSQASKTLLWSDNGFMAEVEVSLRRTAFEKTEVLYELAVSERSYFKGSTMKPALKDMGSVFFTNPDQINFVRFLGTTIKKGNLRFTPGLYLANSTAETAGLVLRK